MVSFFSVPTLPSLRPLSSTSRTRCQLYDPVAHDLVLNMPTIRHYCKRIILLRQTYSMALRLSPGELSKVLCKPCPHLTYHIQHAHPKNTANSTTKPNIYVEQYFHNLCTYQAVILALHLVTPPIPTLFFLFSPPPLYCVS